MRLFDSESSTLEHTPFAFVFFLFVSDKEKVFQAEDVLGEVVVVVFFCFSIVFFFLFAFETGS